MRTMMVVTMLASLATLAAVIFGAGKAQQLQEEYGGKLDALKADPVNSLLSIIGFNKKGV